MNLIVDIKPIKNLPDALLEVNEYGALKIDDGAKTLKVNFCLKGAIKNKVDFYAFDGFIKGSINAYCGRCLEDISLPYEVEVSLKFIELGNFCDPDENIALKGDNADFSNFVTDIITADMPIRFLCTPGCKGLCPKCGKNLNIGSCDCPSGVSVSVFDDLKGMFDNNE